MKRRGFLKAIAAAVALAPVVAEQVAEAADDGYRTELVEVRQIQNLLDEYKRRPEVLAALDQRIRERLTPTLSAPYPFNQEPGSLGIPSGYIYPDEVGVIEMPPPLTAEERAEMVRELRAAFAEAERRGTLFDPTIKPLF